MAHQVSSDMLVTPAPIASPMHHQIVFTPKQYQQLHALFRASTSSTLPSASVRDVSMANVASSSTSTSAPMSGINLSHSVFST